MDVKICFNFISIGSVRCTKYKNGFCADICPPEYKEERDLCRCGKGRSVCCYKDE